MDDRTRRPEGINAPGLTSIKEKEKKRKKENDTPDTMHRVMSYKSLTAMRTTIRAVRVNRRNTYAEIVISSR